MGGRTTLEHLDAVDAFARTLFLRAKQSSAPAIVDVANAVRQLHLALRHLRVESADPDSLLRSADASVYGRQLRPIVEDCDFALKQLETILERYDDGSDNSALADRAEAVQNRLANEKVTIDMFLDTVQLHSRANNAPEAVVGGNPENLEGIKDKVDEIAKRLFNRRAADEDEEGMWQEFNAELEKAGFSSHVLRQHKDILRAYIRELQSMSSENGGAPPTVRGLLEQEALRPMLPPPPLPPKEPLSPKEAYKYGDNDKFDPSIKLERRMPDHAPDNGRSFSSDEASSDHSDALVVISTKDIMAMDGASAGAGNMQLQPRHAGTIQRSLAPPGAAGGSPQRPMVTELSSSANSLNGSPRSIYPYGQVPPGTKPPPGMLGSSPRYVSRLAPDRYGKDIPMDAPWTRIRRSLVSPEVLERAGVRYEARPDYVAILGRVPREQIEAFARQSAECRAARSGRSQAQHQGKVPPRRADPYNPRYHNPPQAQNPHYNHATQDGRNRADSKSSREDDEHSSDSVLWDENDSTDYDDDKTSDKGTKSYPYIVNPPTKEAAKAKTSPASTVMPKPILKNKNENHVRFDPEPYEVDPRRSPPSGTSYSSDEERDRRRDQRRRRTDDRHRHSGRRDYDRDRDRRRDGGRGHKKKGWGDALGAVGIGGAAASLLGVLAQAAVGI